MCGIVGATALRDVPEILLAGLYRLEYRGYDSAGIAVQSADANRFKRLRTLGKVNDLADAMKANLLYGRTGLAHTRWATHGKPSELNAHPHISNDRICVVHNGIIENHEELRKELLDKGYSFESDTDSETVAHLIDWYYGNQKSLVDAVKLAAKRLEGAYTLGAMATNEQGRIVAARVGCPLVVGVGIGERFIASDVLALRPVTDRFVFLEEGDLVDLTADSMTIWNLDDETVIRSTVRVTIDGGEVDKGAYRHHMAREIHEQPLVVRNTLESRLGRNRVIEQAFGVEASNIFDDTKAITIVGCGTAYYAGCIAKYWIEDIVGIPCNAEIASEFRYRRMVVPDGSLFLSLSQSGETADTIAALRVARKKNFVHTVTISNVPTSTLVRESDLALLMQAGPEISVASTKAFTAMLVDLILLTLLLARRTSYSEKLEMEVVKALRGLDGIVSKVLELDDAMLKLAQEFVHQQHALFLGRGPQYPVALEGALKLKEISYMHAEGYPAGELKHGPLALVDSDMPVVAVAPNNDLLEKVQSNLQEVRARGGRLYVFADSDAGFETCEGVTVIEVPRVHPLLAPIIYVVPLQMLAYHVAVLKGTDVDQPRNLAKSVTVE